MLSTPALGGGARVCCRRDVDLGAGLFSFRSLKRKSKAEPIKSATPVTPQTKLATNRISLTRSLLPEACIHEESVEFEALGSAELGDVGGDEDAPKNDIISGGEASPAGGAPCWYPRP